MLGAFCDHDYSWMVLLRRAVFRIPFWCQTYQPLSDLLCIYGWTGGFLKLDLVWVIADIVNGLMALPNLIALLALSPVIIKESKQYFKK